MKIARIHYKLSASYLLVLIVSMAISSVLFFRFVGGYVERQVGQQLQNQADFMAKFLGQYNGLPDPSDLPMAGKEFETSFADVLRSRLQVTNREGLVISDTGNSEGGMLEPPDLQAALLGQSSVWSRVEQGQQVVHATSPIRAHGGVVGLVDLSTPLEDQTHLHDLRDLLLLAFGVALLVSWAMSSVLSRSITRPIAAMKEAAVRLSHGDWSHTVAHQGHDELADLGQSINRMAVALQAQMAESRRQQETMTTLLESLADGVVALDSTLHVRFLNSAARRMLGLPDGVMNRPVLELWPYAGLTEVLSECRTENRLVQREEIAGERRVQVFAVPYDLPTGTDTADQAPVMLVLRDVTELRRLEDVRSTFLSSVSHELRTPLTIIKGFAVTVEDAASADPDMARSVSVINRETDRLTRLVDDILELSRLRSHRRELERAPLLLDAVVAETVQHLQPRAAALGVKLEVHADSGGIVQADADRIRQIVMNLVDNALKYTPEGGRATVSTRVEGNRLWLEVADTGVGIAAEDQSYLFERFFRTRDTGRKGVQGTGLGLAIVKELVELHQGGIEVHSEVQRGTTLRVWFPLPVTVREAGSPGVDDA